MQGTKKHVARVGLLVALGWVGAAIADGTRVAHADEAITIKLKNGNLVRGELVERVNGDKIVLKLATGEVRVLAWADVEAPEQVGSPPPPVAATAAPNAPASASAAPPASPLPASPTKSGVTVTLESDTPGTHLSTFAGSSTGTATSTTLGSSSYAVDAQHYRFVCAAPCSKEVDPELQYVVNGPHLKPSEPFAVTQGMKLRAEPVGDARGLSGLALVGMGAGLGFSGIAFGAIFLASSADNEAKQTAGVAFLAVGLTTALVTLPIGIYLLATNHTKVFDASGQRVAVHHRAPALRLPALRLGVRGVEF